MSKERLIKSWREAKDAYWRDYIAFLFYEHFDEAIYNYVY